MPDTDPSLVLDSQDLPPSRRLEIKSLLVGDECVLGWFVPDLDDSLHYAEGLVVLTDRRLMSLPAGPARESSGGGRTDIDDVPPAASRAGARVWPLAEVEALRSRDRAGVGTLEAIGPAGRLGHWRYTITQAPAAARLVDHLERYRRGERAEDEGLDEAEPDEADDAARVASSRSLWRLLRFAIQRGRLVTLGFLLTLVTTAVGLVPPYLTMPLMDEVLIPYQNRVAAARVAAGTPADGAPALDESLRAQADAGFAKVLWYLAALGGAALAAWGTSWAQGVVMAWVSERIGADLRNATYAHLQSLSLEFFGKKRTGDLIARISSDTERICNYLADNLVDFGTDGLMIVATAVVLAWIDPWLALVTLIPFPVIGWSIYRVRGQLQQGFQRGGRAWGAMTSLLADTIPGIRVVKAFAQESREIERFGRANAHVVEVNDRVNTIWTFFWPTVVLLNQVGLVVVWAYGAWRVFQLQITVGVLTAFLTYIRGLYVRLESMSRMMTATERAAASAHRVFDILDRTPHVAEPRRPVACDRLRGEVEFAGVDFRYGSRPILEHVNLAIRPGEMIGLVGPSGAGKSTLVNLVCRFYDVTEGALLVDGVDIRSYAVEAYRRHIGIVLQEPFLFFGTIAENIAYGRPDAARDEIIAAARAARAHDFILRLPLGYDSLVGERGQMLSGGERQRISIARALLIDPRILILDEATSSVDTETERDIQAALDNLVRGRTTIAIAHRLSTLRKADRLIVLERGRIVEMGEHQQLLEAGGVYARLYEAQHQAAEGLVE